MAEVPGPETAYETLDLATKARRVVGQIFQIPALLAMQGIYVVRLGRWDRKSPITTVEFQLKRERPQDLGRDQDLYQHMPIPELKLKMREELTVRKVKRRPALLIVRDGVDPRRMANHAIGIGPTPNATEHLFAPIISLRKEENVDTDYPEEFIDMVMNDAFPEFMFLPAQEPVLPNDSMAVFSQLQPHNINTVEATALRVKPLDLAAKLETFYRELEGQLLE